MIENGNPGHRQRKTNAIALMVVLAMTLAAVVVWASRQTKHSAAPSSSHPASVTHNDLFSGSSNSDKSQTPISLSAPHPSTAETHANTNLAIAIQTVTATWPEDSCLVVEVGDTRVVSIRPDQLLAPASTQKLFTAVAVLAGLGPEHQFITRLMATQPLTAHVLRGDVFLVGDGDPVFSTNEYQATQRHQPALATSIDQLANDIVATGVQRIEGSIIGDETKFADDRFLPSWGYPYDYATRTGPLSALVINDGWANSRDVQPDPATFAATTLRGLLESRGVTVTGVSRTGKAPASSTEIASVASPKLSDIVNEMLRNSDNMTAEMLGKDLDAAHHGPGTIAAAATRISSTLARHSLPIADATVQDASGTDSANRATCNDLTNVLHAIGSNSDIARNGLPQSGRTGTLSNRFTNPNESGRVHAKTGSIYGAASLAGFIDPPPNSANPKITFAFIVNNTTNTNRYDLEDQLIATLTS